MGKKNVEDQEKRFYTFGTKSFSVNKTNFDGSFLSRCITIHTVKNKKKVKNVFTIGCEDERKFQEIRNKLFVFCLFNWRELIKSIEKNKDWFENKELYGRPSDVGSIICGIHEYFTGEDEIRTYFVNKENFEKETSKDNDRFYFTLKYIVELIQISEESVDYIVLNAQNVKDFLIEEMEIKEEKYKPTPQSIGKLFKSHRLVDENTDREQVTSGEKKGHRVWKPKKEKLIDIINRSQFEDLKVALRNKCPNASELKERRWFNSCFSE